MAPHFHPDALRQRRLALGWTQFDLAVASGVGLSTITNAERGARVPKAAALIALAHALGGTVEDLYCTDEVVS
jgi:transcriptional regulator with XRE-family HTH domain